MGTVVSRSQCPKCMDSGHDNLIEYDDGGRYCFSCDYTEGSDMEQTDKPKKKKPVGELIRQGEFRTLSSRGLTKETCEKFGIKVSKFTGYLGKEQVREANVIVYDHYKNGKLIKQKIRSLQDRSRTTQRGDLGVPILFGQHALQPNPKRFLVITEGEFDAASVYQAAKFSTVSITKGCKGAKKELSEHLDWLSQWNYVVLAFDNDEPGQAATAECLELFEPGKVRVASWPLKDANEMLVEGRARDIAQIIWDAKECGPDDIITINDMIDEISAKPKVGHSLPWKPMTDIMYGLRTNEIIVIAGGTGLGKTEIIKDMILHMTFELDSNVGLFSFEQRPADTIRRLVGGVLKKPLHIPGEWWDEKVIQETARKFDNKVFTCNKQGPMSIDDLCSKIRYLKKAKNVDYFIVDHLKALTAAMKDKLTGVEDAMAKLKGVCNELEVTIVIVAHLAKDKKSVKVGQEDDSWRNGRRPVLENLYGSSAVEAWADFVFGISRNANSDDPEEQLITRVQCLKARLDGSKGGHYFDLRYNISEGRLEEYTPTEVM